MKKTITLVACAVFALSSMLTFGQEGTKTPAKKEKAKKEVSVKKTEEKKETPAKAEGMKKEAPAKKANMKSKKK